MFKHGGPPYQATVVPRSEAQVRQLEWQRRQYPWIERPRDCPSGDSSDDARCQIVRPIDDRRVARNQSPVYHVPYQDKPCPSPPPPHRYVLPDNRHNCHDQDSDISAREYAGVPTIVPARSPVPSEIRAPGGCGGHCPGFEYVCYYVLQIIFVVGILTGISLCIAGSVLRRSNRSSDLGVLVYIGCLASMVCGVLLGVQCCVRRSTKRRCKQMRLRAIPPDCIPLETIPNPHAGEVVPNYSHDVASTRLIYPVAPTMVSTLPRTYYRSEERHHVHSSSIDEINGVPWWRR